MYRPALATITLLAASVASAGTAAAKAPSTLTGTVAYTAKLVTHTDDGRGTVRDITEQHGATFKIRMSRRPGSSGWQVDDNGSSFRGDYSSSAVTKESDLSGALQCTTTTTLLAKASGNLPKRPTSTTAPVLFGTVAPNLPGLGKGTKALVLLPIVNVTGDQTQTSVGSGISPCQSGSDTGRETVHLTPNNDSRQLCYPAGVKPSVNTPNAGQLVGAWSAKKRAFTFDCSKTHPEPDGQTVTLTVTGKLKAT